MENYADIFHQRPPAEIGKAVPTSWGSMNFNVLRNIFAELNTIYIGRGAEVGVFQANTSEYLLKSFPGLELLCIDPFQSYEEHESEMTAARLRECEAIATARLEPFGARAKLIKLTSVEAAEMVPDQSLDFVFIDAVHSYEAVLEDLHAWFPKVRVGGIVSGHDYSWPGVREALEEFLLKVNRAAHYTPQTSDVWFFQK